MIQSEQNSQISSSKEAVSQKDVGVLETIQAKMRSFSVTDVQEERGVVELPKGKCATPQPMHSYDHCTFVEINLSNSDLHGSSFQNVNFTKANLEGSNFNLLICKEQI